MAQEIIYISPKGNNLNKGTKESLFLTLEEVREYARNLSSNKATIIYPREGQCQLKQTFSLNQQDSRTENAPLIISAYPDKKVSLFWDKSNKQFNLKNGKIIFNDFPGFEAIDFSKIGCNIHQNK